jgi:hypothetical protein
MLKLSSACVRFNVFSTDLIIVNSIGVKNEIDESIIYLGFCYFKKNSKIDNKSVCILIGYNHYY